MSAWAERVRGHRVELAVAAAVLVVAAGLRLWDLPLKPMHHDEGVNGFFLQGLLRDGSWRYDPTNYHGPTLYYLAAAISFVTGLTTTGVRLTTALAGLATVGLVLVGFRRSLGSRAALLGAALIAVSPGSVYFSRYFIHESLVVLFTVAPVVAALSWARSGDRRALLAAAGGLALLFATKETAILHAAVLAVAWPAAGWLTRGRRAALPDGDADARARAEPAAPDTHSPPEGIPGLGGEHEAGLGLPWPGTRWALACAGVFVAIHVVLYSSLLTHWQGVADSVRALVASQRTATTAHLNPWYQHLEWLYDGDRVALVLGGAGAVWALAQRRCRVAVFVALWAAGLLAAYSAVSYKTPWLGFNAVAPLAIVGGWALARTWRFPVLGFVLSMAALSVSAFGAVRLNFFSYDDEREPYVYAHTRRGFLELVAEVERLAEASGQGHRMPITVVTPEHWPLPWYLREYPGAGYHGKLPERVDGVVVVGRDDQDAELARVLGSTFRRVGEYPLRPGVELVVYARWDVLARSLLPPPVTD